jgi:hypothetical protein
VRCALIGLVGALGRAEVGALGRAEVGALGRAEVGALGRAEVGALGCAEVGALGRAEVGALGSTLSMLTIMISGASSSRGPEGASGSITSSGHIDGSDLGRTTARVPLLVRCRTASISAREIFCVAWGSPRGSGRVEGISTMPFGQSRAPRRCFTAAL